MQQPPLEMALRELTHPTHNEQLKNQQQVTFKLVKTGKLSYDTFAWQDNAMTVNYYVVLINFYVE